MSKQEVVELQTSVLRVNIHCHGCEHKVRKLLRRTEGVYMAEVDAGQGKVTVTGNVDPGTLIQKLERSGKHAELWSAPKDGTGNNQNQNFNNQLENMMKQKMESHGMGGGGGQDGKLRKGGRSDGGGNGVEEEEDESKLGGGFGQNQQQQAVAAAFQAQWQRHMMNMKIKGVKDPRFPPGNRKNVEFKVADGKPNMGLDDLNEEELDDDVEGHDRASDDGYRHSNGHQKAATTTKQQGDGGKGLKVGSTKKSEVVDEKWCSKRGGMFDIQGLMKVLGKGGGDGKKRREARKDGSSNGGGKINSNEEGGGKKGGKKKKKKKNSKRMQSQQPEFSDSDGGNQMAVTSGSVADGGGGGLTGPMGRQMGSYPIAIANYPVIRGLPEGMHGGGGMKMMNHQDHPHQQQQLYGGHNDNNGEMFRPAMMMMYAGSHPPPPMPPPSKADTFLDMFSDDNTSSSCSVM